MENQYRIVMDNTRIDSAWGDWREAQARFDLLANLLMSGECCCVCDLIELRAPNGDIWESISIS